MLWLAHDHLHSIKLSCMQQRSTAHKALLFFMVSDRILLGHTSCMLANRGWETIEFLLVPVGFQSDGPQHDRSLKVTSRYEFVQFHALLARSWSADACYLRPMCLACSLELLYMYRSSRYLERLWRPFVSRCSCNFESHWYLSVISRRPTPSRLHLVYP